MKKRQHARTKEKRRAKDVHFSVSYLPVPLLLAFLPSNMINMTDLPSDILIHIASFLPDSDDYDDDWYPETSERVTFAGVLNNYDMLEYYLQQRKDEEDKGYFMNSLARSGNIRAVQWARKQGIPIDEDTCNVAARYGNWDMVKWLHSEGCPWNKETHVIMQLNKEILKC